MALAHRVKVVILGESAVGKTSLKNYFVDGEAVPTVPPTIGVDFKIKKVLRLNGASHEQVQVQVWDMAGQERFRTITPSMYRGGQGPTVDKPVGLFVCYDCCNRTTFDGVNFCIDELRMHASENVVTCLVGNKKDAAEAGNRQVSREEGEALSKTLKMDHFCETSAFTGECVEEMFLKVIDEVLERILHDEELAEANPQSVTSATTKVTPASFHASRYERAQAELKLKAWWQRVADLCQAPFSTPLRVLAAGGARVLRAMSSTEEKLGADYTGELTPLAIRRLAKERDQITKEVKLLNEQGMYFHFDDTRNNKAVVLIVGPEDTPYSGGFYMFEFTFPNSYPLEPPHVKFMTGDGRVRFNPILDINGKVWLSILGTCHGSSWTAACTFRSTVFSIQSLLHARPLQNEPGYEMEAGKDCELYSSMLRYENVAVAVMQLSVVPDSLRPLRPRMAQIFVRRMADYLKVLDDFDKQEGKHDKCPLYGFTTRYMPSEARKELAKLKQKLLEDTELKDDLATEEAAVVGTSSSAIGDIPSIGAEKRAASLDGNMSPKRQRVDA